jgi:hypothetical protein
MSLGSLAAGCPRCASPVTEWDGSWACSEHGPVPPLWRPRAATYDAFAEVLRRSPGFPTYLPWPMSPGWSVSDFGVVGERPDRAVATVTCCSGTSELDGPVDVFVVAEEPGTGLGGRCAGVAEVDPAPLLAHGPPEVKVRIGSQAVPLWPLTTSGADAEFDRSVLAGEAGGRWLWVIMRPASAVLLLRDDWILTDVSGVGAPLLEMSFGGAPPLW